MRLSNRERILNTASAVTAIGAFLLVWQLSSMYTTLGELIPGPLAVIQYLFSGKKIGRHTFLSHCGYSMSRVLIAYTAACFVGVSLGLLMGWYKRVEAFVMPLFNLVRPVPPIAWTSLAILWFGLGEMPKWFIIFIAAFCNVVINAYDGARSVDRQLVGCAKMLGSSDRQIFLRVVLPSAVPYIFAGMQIALSNSWAAVVAAEMIRASEGLGWVIVTGQSVNNMEQILAGIVMIGIIGLLLSVVMRKVEERCCRWNRSGI